ncbi:MAG TPA: DUF3365 domain-containing protein, partial [Phycisphaerae bacterium]|nr:DUF3365 domain-containing protein [Phycisphaerae bacterium]
MFDRGALRRHTALAAVAWTVVIAALLCWYWWHEHWTFVETARTYARAAHEKDLSYRRWSSLHSGAYVPVTEQTQPNPYLKAPERDIVTPSGRRLTLINPAYMTRQVHEMEQSRDSIVSRITSLKPVSPANVPDDWEMRALRAFEQG